MKEPTAGDQVKLRTGSGTAIVTVVGVYPGPVDDFERQVAFRIVAVDESYDGVFENGLGIMWPLSLFLRAIQG